MTGVSKTTDGAKTIIYPVKDLAGAKALYGTLLGVAPDADESYFVGFAVGEQYIGLDPHGHTKGMTGPVVYWHVPDIEASLTSLTGSGAVVVGEPKDVGGGKLIATLKDADGNVLGLVQNPA